MLTHDAKPVLIALLLSACACPAMAQSPSYEAGEEFRPGTIQEQRTNQTPTAAPAQARERLSVDGGAQGQNLEKLTQEDADALYRDDPEIQAAFQEALTSLLPMTPAQIRELLKRVGESQQAASAPLPRLDGGWDNERLKARPPTPEVHVETLNMAPGAPPPVIQAGVGYVTTLTILDATGQPWPIVDIGVGGNFDVPEPAEGAHVVRITPLSRFGAGNLSIRLLNLATPITFQIESGGEVIHYRYDARIPRFGPLAKAPLIDRGVGLVAGDATLMSVLEGLPPSGSEAARIKGADGRTTAWYIGDKLYVRTPLTLLSPGWDGSVSSADGMHVYMLADAPVLLLSDSGVMVRAGVSRDKTDYDQLAGAR